MSFNKEGLLEKIKRGDIKLKPKWLFVFRFLGLLIGAIISVMFLIFIVSLVIFIIFYNNNSIFRNLDLVSLKMIFSALPWLMLPLMIIFIVLFELFIKQIVPLYRKPLIIVIISIGILLLVTSIGVNQSETFKSLCTCNRSAIKPLEWILNQNELKYNQIIRTGKVINLNNSNKIEIKLEDGEDILIDRNSFCSHCLKTLIIGDPVIISGFEKNGKFMPFKGKSQKTNCSSCTIGNEIKNNNSCNTIWKVER